MSGEHRESEAVIDVVFDNSPGDRGLAYGWGFSCTVRSGAETLLFDTGNEGGALLGNLRALGMSPTDIGSVFLSHAHGDHAGGLMAFLEANPEACVYVLRTFPSSLRLEAKFRAARLVELDGPSEILPGMWSTGMLGGGIPEQALVIQTPAGGVVITGCAHPGIESIVARARELFDVPVLLVLGGFHLLDESSDSVATVGAALQRMGVQNLAPCHCTGTTAIARLREVFEERFLDISTGTRIDTGLLAGARQ